MPSRQPPPAQLQLQLKRKGRPHLSGDSVFRENSTHLGSNGRERKTGQTHPVPRGASTSMAGMSLGIFHLMQVGVDSNFSLLLHIDKYLTDPSSQEKVNPWTNLEDIMLSEISQSQKDKFCVVPFL